MLTLKFPDHDVALRVDADELTDDQIEEVFNHYFNSLDVEPGSPGPEPEPTPTLEPEQDNLLDDLNLTADEDLETAPQLEPEVQAPEPTFYDVPEQPPPLIEQPVEAAVSEPQLPVDTQQPDELDQVMGEVDAEADNQAREQDIADLVEMARDEVETPENTFFRDANKAIDTLSPFFMTAAEEKSMRAKHPNLMALRYAAASLLLPGVSEKFASPEEMEAFTKKSTEDQRLEILGLTAGYMAFGAVGKGARALLGLAAKKFPVLTKPIAKVFKDSNWFRRMTNKERGLVVQSIDDMKKGGLSEPEILRNLQGPERQKFFDAAMRDRGAGSAAETVKPKAEIKPVEIKPVVEAEPAPVKPVELTPKERLLAGTKKPAEGEVAPVVKESLTRGSIATAISDTKKEVKGKQDVTPKLEKRSERTAITKKEPVEPPEAVEPETPEFEPDHTYSIGPAYKKGLAPQPKDFKIAQESMLEAIDEAIKNVPEEGGGMVRFEDPFGTSHDILNQKKALQQFEKGYKSLTLPPKRPAKPKKPTRPKSQLTKEKWRKNEMRTVKGWPGWITDRVIAIKSAPPKGKLKWLEDDVQTAAGLKSLTERTDLVPAHVRYYTSIDPDVGDAVGKTPVTQLSPESGVQVVLKAGKRRFVYDAHRFNVIQNRYPDATFKIDTTPDKLEHLLVAYDKGEMVAGMSALQWYNEGKFKKAEKDVPGIKQAAKMGIASPEIVKKEIPPVPSEIKFTPIPPGAKRQFILKTVQSRLDLPIKLGKIPAARKAAGIYNPHSKVVRLKYANDFPVAIHEIGHHIQSLIGFPRKMRMPKEVMAMAYPRAKNKSIEGFAEFVRFYVTEPVKAKAEAPTFYKTFEKALAEHTDVQELFLKSRQSWKTFQAAPSVAKVHSVIVQSGDVKPPRTTLNEIYAEIKDNLHPFRVVTDIAKKKGGTIDYANDPYIAARLLRGWPRMADQYARLGTFQRVGDEVKFTGPGLKEILKDVESAGERPLLDAYLVSKRAVNDRRIVTGFRGQLTLKDFEQTVKELEPKYKDVAEALYKYNDELLQYLVDAGRISQELAERIRAKNLFYAPLYRLMDTVTSFERLGQKAGTVANPIKKLKGSSRDILSPTENILKNTYAMINAAERTRVGQKLLNLANIPGMGKYIERVSAPLKATKMDTKEALEQIAGQLKATGDIETQIAIDQIIDSLSGDNALVRDVLTTFRADKTRVGKNEVLFYVKGEPQLVELDPWLHKAVSNLEAGEISLLIKVLSYPAKWLRAGATTFSPEFGLRNPAKDQWTALIQSDYGYVPVYDLIRGIFHITKGTKAWQEFNASGGPLSHIVAMDQRHLNKNLKAMMQGGSFLGLVKNPLALVQRISELGEEGTRVGEFLRARGKGKGLSESGIASKDVSVDFSRIGGPSARSANLISAFWNASLEGFDRMARRFHKRPLKTIILGFLGVTLPTLLLWYKQKDDPAYQELPSWRRTMAWNYIDRNEDGSLNRIWSLYRPFTYGLLFGAVFEMVANWWYTNDRAGLEKTFEHILKTLNFIPIPTAAIPVFEWWANKSWFFDRPIVPRDKEALEPALQYGRHTSETTKLVGRLMKDIPVLKEFGNPAKIENLIRGYTAGFGRMALEGTDWLLKQMGAVKTSPDPSMTLNDIPGIRAFTLRFPSAHAESIERFYREYNLRKRSLESTKQRLGLRGSDADTKAKKQLSKGMSETLTVLRDTAGALSMLRKIADRIYKDQLLTPELKKRRLDITYYLMINLARAYYGKAPLEFGESREKLE